MTDIPSRLALVHDRIVSAASAAGRDPAEIALLAVSKAQPAAAVAAAAAAGQRAFGENYLQEALTKMAVVKGIEWHFIGRIQANKARDIAANFDWVQGIDRQVTAARLAAGRPAASPPLSVCIQVNVSAEARKGGVHPDAVVALAAAIAGMPRLRLRGLMTIPAVDDAGAFTRMRGLFDDLNRSGHALDTLSMGMSDDLEAAIAAGATMVRVGTAVFGAR